MSDFATASAVRPLGDGRFEIQIDPDWFGVGPHGGFLAATILRSLSAHVEDPTYRAVPARRRHRAVAARHRRHPLSLTCHFLTPLSAGAAVVTVTTERAGRGVTALSARMDQEGKTGVLALATFGVEREGAIDFDTPAPRVPPPEDVEQSPVPERTLPLVHRLEYRPCIGDPPFSSSSEALAGGWSRLADHGPLDEPALAFLADAWPPSAWARLTGPALSPTIDMTFHFRSRVNPGTEWALVRTRSLTSKHGFWEEDGEIWAPDGTLLAQSRQLALLRPVPV